MSGGKIKLSDQLKQLNQKPGKGEQKGTGHSGNFAVIRLIIACILAFIVPALSISSPLSAILLICAGLIAGFDLIVAGVQSILHEDYFNRNATVTLVFIISFVIGVGYEGALLIIITCLGVLLSDYVKQQTREQVLSMTGLEFETANVLDHGRVTEKYLDDVRLGDEISVLAGEYFPLDCIVMEGSSMIDTSRLTGSVKPQTVSVGDTVYAGSANLSGNLRCEVISENSSAAADILELLCRAEEEKKNNFTKIFTPVMMLVSIVFGFVIAIAGQADAYEAVHRALSLFTLSSAVPAFAWISDIRFAARSGAATRGVLFTSDEAMEKAERCGSVVFSAEGTLTAGKQKVVSIETEKMDSQTFLKIAAHAMAFSKDPVADAIIKAYNGPIYIELIEDFVEIPRCGVKVVFDGVPVILGNQGLMAAVSGGTVVAEDVDNATMFMVIGKTLAGTITLSDPIRKSAGKVVTGLQANGVEDITFVTAYSGSTAKRISKKSGITDFSANCGEDAKLQLVEKTVNEHTRPVMYVCDQKWHINEHSAADLDAVVGCLSNVKGTASADIIIPGIQTGKLNEGIATAKRTHKLCNGSAVLLFAVKAILLVLAALGVSTVWFSALVETAAMLLVGVFASQAFYEHPFSNLKPANKLKATE